MRFGYPECDRRSVRPPSTVRTWAVIKLASSLARNSTAAAMSSGSPSRPRSVRLTVASITWAGKAEIKSVRMKPGQMALTLMPWDLRSSATRFVRPMIAALLTAYGVLFAAVEPIPAVEDKLIIFPYRRSIIFGITAQDSIERRLRTVLQDEVVGEISSITGSTSQISPTR